MFRKIIIRLCFIMLILAGILFAVAAKSDHDYYSCQTTAPAADDQEPDKSTRKEFIIWESFSRSLMSTVKF